MSTATATEDTLIIETPERVPLHFAREIAKDLDDAHGDASFRRTLPLRVGAATARALEVPTLPVPTVSGSSVTTRSRKNRRLKARSNRPEYANSRYARVFRSKRASVSVPRSNSMKLQSTPAC